LTILSNISVVGITELLNGALDSVRWTLAGSPYGVGLATFLALSKTTGLVGVFGLLISNQQVGHRKWCVLRYFRI
jgi:hypothetical protein